VAFFEYRYQGYAVSFGSALGDAFAESVRRTAGSPRFRGWRVRSASVSVEPVDGSDLVDVYVSAEVGGESAAAGERAFEALVREASASVGVRSYGFDAPEDCPLGVHDLAVASSACYG
jgi:hypothetical protein